MALQSANGGDIIVAGSPNITIPNQRWNGNWRVRDAEVTQSDSNGCTLYQGVVQDNEWEVGLCRDDAAFPESLGLVAGTVLSALFFKLGAGSKADRLQNTLVTDVSPVNDNTNDVVKVTVRGKGGKLT